MEAGDVRALQHRSGDEAGAATEIRARALQGRQPLEQKGGAVVQPIPAEQSRLTDGVQNRDTTRSARIDRLIETDRMLWRIDDADPVVAPPCLFDLTAKFGKLPTDPGAALVLAGERHETRAGFERAQSQRQHGPAFQDAGGSVNDRAIQ